MYAEDHKLKEQAMTTVAKRTTIALLGTYGFGNLGDGAIQHAAIQNIRKYCPDVEVVGISLNPDDTEKRYKIRAFAITRPAEWQDVDPNKTLLGRLSVFLRQHPNRWVRKLERLLVRLPWEIVLLVQAFRDLSQVDHVFGTGGGQLVDIWGGPFTHPYIMLKWSLLARLRGKRVAFVSMGAGPVHASLSRRFIRWALRLANYRSYRDQGAKDFLNGIGFRNDDPVYPDLAFSIQVERKTARPPAAQRTVAISPMAFRHPSFWPEQDEAFYHAYLEKLADFAAWLIAKEYQIVWFSTSVGNDEYAIADLQAKLTQRGVSLDGGAVRDASTQTVDEVLETVASVDAVVATRFHGVLLSMLVGTPAMAVAYHPKTEHLMADGGLANYCFSIEDFDVAEMKARFAELEQERDAIQTRMAQHVARSAAQLHEQYLRIFDQFGIGYEPKQSELRARAELTAS